MVVQPLNKSLLLLLVLAGAMLLVGLSACGGSDDDSASLDADSDAQEVLDGALGSSGDPIESGVLGIEFGLESTEQEGAAINAAIDGPFSSNGDGELPSIDFDVTAGADTGGAPLSFDGALTLTTEGLFVEYGGEAYQLDDVGFTELKDAYRVSSQNAEDDAEEGGSLSQFGVDASDWLEDVTNEGVEDVDGTETVHISGSGNIPQIIEDLDAIARQSGQEQAPAALQQLEDSIGAAQVDVYADAGDGTLRRLDTTLEVANGPSGGTSTVTLSIGIADPNSEQEISGPTDARPLDELLAQLGAAPSLSDIAPGTAPPSGTGDTGETGAAPDADAYYQCVAEAPTPKEVAECSKLLGG